MKIGFAVIFSLALNTVVNAKDLLFDNLVDSMQGSFSSQQQAAQDSSYFDIRLQVARIWPNEEKGVWLYVEQAAADYLQKPYRQRIYHLYRVNEEIIQSDIYTLAKPDQFIGAYQSVEIFDTVNKEAIKLREGCSVQLFYQLETEQYEGSTQAKSCKSELRGASYATSIVTVGRNRLVSWDQGFNSEDKQVWGAEKGPYIFLRQ